MNFPQFWARGKSGDFLAWRCGIYRKPERWPWLDEKQQQRFLRWDEKYQARSADWATCKFLRQIGTPKLDVKAQEILKLHDDRTRAASDLRLA